MPNLPRTRDRSRDFDIVLWGATGFTGQLVADYLVRNYLHRNGNHTKLRLALAGRNEEKLKALAQEVGATDLPILIGDSFDGASLDVGQRVHHQVHASIIQETHGRRKSGRAHLMN